MSKEITAAKPQTNTIRTLLESDEFKMQVARALPRHLTPERFIRVAATTMMRTPALANCDQASFFNALLTLSQLGLEPDNRNAHLIPFRNNKTGKTDVQLIVDYKGLVDLAMRSGTVANIHADKVCENDAFEYDRGQIIKHKIDFRAPRGKAYAYYATVKFKDGTEKSEVMTKEDVDAIRKRSKASSAGPWVTDYDEMAKKTAFRRLTKWIQLSPEFRDALEHDADRVEALRVESAKPVFAIDAPQEDAAPAKKLTQEIVEKGQAEMDKANQEAAQDPDFSLSGEPPSLHERIKTNLRDQSIDEVDFLKKIRADFKVVLASVSELKEEHAAEILENWDAVTEGLAS
jgi:recombination protein RecT